MEKNRRTLFEIENRTKELDATSKSIELARIRTNDELMEASYKNQQAELALENAQSIFNRVSNECGEREKKVSLIEVALDQREVTLQQREHAVIDGQKMIEDGWRLLKDREQMLERSLKRK